MRVAANPMHLVIISAFSVVSYEPLVQRVQGGVHLSHQRHIAKQTRVFRADNVNLYTAAAEIVGVGISMNDVAHTREALC